MPALIVMNMSIDGYYLPGRTTETVGDLLQFLDSILTGKSEVSDHFHCSVKPVLSSGLNAKCVRFSYSEGTDSCAR